jgi:hypothetical protein
MHMKLKTSNSDNLDNIRISDYSGSVMYPLGSTDRKENRVNPLADSNSRQSGEKGQAKKRKKEQGSAEEEEEEA